MSASDPASATAVDWRPDPAAIARQLQPLLSELEGVRLNALARRNRARFAAGIIAGVGIFLAMAAGGRSGFFGFIMFAVVSLALAALIHRWIHGGAVAAYRDRFKSTAFRHAARVVAPGVDYSPTAMVPQQSFERGGLFKSRIDRYLGEDCFHGKAGATDILLSELHVQREDTSTDSKGNTQTTWVTVFRGIYLIADFHKHFNGRLTIEPDVAEANFGWLGRKLQGVSRDLIRLENPEFERAFKVRASDPVEARYLLTPDMQERFLDLRNRWSPGIRAALMDSSLHLAIPMRENWFEPSIKVPAHEVQPLAVFLQQLVVLLHIPEQLDLNTRIWTKS